MSVGLCALLLPSVGREKSKAFISCVVCEWGGGGGGSPESLWQSVTAWHCYIYSIVWWGGGGGRKKVLSCNFSM